MLAKAGIQKSLKFLDSGSRYPGLDPGLAGMTFEIFKELKGHHTERLVKEHAAGGPRKQ